MNRKWLLISLFTVSCGSAETDVQNEGHEHLSSAQMIPLIVDLQIIQEHYHNLFVRPDIYHDALDSASFFVFEKHHTTKEEFNQSLTYWSGMPDTLYAIYEAALDTVNFRINAHRATSNPESNP